MIIQTILLYPSGAVWTDDESYVSRLDPSGAVQSDAEHPARNRRVAGARKPGTKASPLALLCQSPCHSTGHNQTEGFTASRTN
jgi:hypothetical protein